MIKTFDKDRKFIERKYHIPGEPFNGYARWNYHGYPYDENTGISDEEIREGLKGLRERIKEESHLIQKAKYFAYVLDNTRIDVNEHDYFIGIWTWARPLTAVTSDIWAAENDRRFLDAAEIQRSFFSSGIVIGSLDYDHTVPDWDSLMELGFSGILKRLNDTYRALSEKRELTQKQIDFYHACVTEYEAIIRLIDRLYRYALTKTHDKAAKYAACLKHLRDGAPTDFYEALQMIYIYFMISEHIENYQVRSLGFGLDATLYPFFEKDIKSGKYTEEEIREFLKYFLMQWSSIGNIFGQPFYLGGRDRQGNCKVNELSYLILKTYDALDIFNPKIQIKVSDNTPKDFIYLAMEMIRDGRNSIVFIHDEMVVKCLMAGGATYEDAIDSVISGCYEYKVKNKAIGISGAYFNLLKIVSLVFNNGFDTVANRQIGLKTGEIDTFKSFDDFYAAYLKQSAYIVNTYLDAMRQLETGIGTINPSLMFSSTIKTCVDTMTDAIDGGIVNSSGTLLSGLGSAVDAIMAVYELVYEKKVTTLAELKTALLKDWEGYELLRLKALNCKHKYGCDDEMSDSYAAALLRFYCDEITSRKNCKGRRLKVELHSAYMFVRFGEKTEATPNGRKYGEETSKNASPHPGSDTNGVTAMINSATRLDTALPTVGMCLDVMLHPTTVQGEDGPDVLYNVMRTYMDKGGQSIHFNIFNADLLRDAQINPEKYKNLQVRVCGWNSLWNNLSKAEQDAYILRAEKISQ